jgi:HD-GYP domain-containing protein (c-di-GMP phosphodiesterase class II)
VIIRHAYVKLNTLQRLYDELDSAHVRLEQNVHEQLEVMVRSIEARDPYTSGHSRRVAALSKAIAVDFGLSDELTAEVENAALLHDVGKIHAEFAPLLQKEGKLTPEEWEIMKTHSVRSAELVKLFSRFHGFVVDSVLHHHERWDGLGYPVGVSGEQIPLGARIIMIADTIDAMTTDRPYRKALGFDAVVGELQKYRGTQFDPKLVDTVVASMSIRRLLAEQATEHYVVEKKEERTFPPLRSHGSFFVGRRRGESVH